MALTSPYWKHYSTIPDGGIDCTKRPEEIKDTSLVVTMILFHASGTFTAIPSAASPESTPEVLPIPGPGALPLRPAKITAATMAISLLWAPL